MDYSDLAFPPETLQKILSTVTVHAKDSIIITEAEPIGLPGPRILYVNDAFCELTGYTRDEVLGKTPRILQGDDTDPASRKRIREALEAWQPVTEELKNYTKDGTPFWAELSIVPVADETGWYTHWFAIQRDITARKQTEQALRRSEDRYRSLVDNLPGIVYRCTYDTEWRTLYMSEGLEELCGYSNLALKTNQVSFRDLVHPDDVDAIREAVREAVRERGAYSVEYRMCHPDGGIRWVSDSGRPHFDDDGRVCWLDGFMVDVTARKQDDARLRMLEAAVNDTTESVLITDAQMDRPGPQIVYVNPGFERMTGYRAEDVLGRTPRLLQGPETDDELLKHLRHQLDHGERFYGTTVNYRKDNTPFYNEWSISPVLDESGQPTHYVAVQRDVTERRQTMQQLRILYRAVEHATDAVLIATATDEPTINYANPALERLLGRTAEDLSGQPLHTWMGADPAALMEEGHAFTTELALSNRDGAQTPVEVNASPIVSEEGDILYWVVVIRNLTATRRIEMERAARQRAEDVARLKDNLLRNLSHEIRTPLTGILGTSQILLEETDGSTRELLQGMHASGERLMDTLNAILELAELKQNEVAYPMSTIDLAALVRRCADTYATKAEAKGVAFRVAVGPSPVRLESNMHALQRICHNLFSNAVKFTDEGHVLVRVDHQGDELILEVQDTGCGIDKSFLPHLFEEFRQESNGDDRMHEGTGLGLAITKGLADRIGARIEVRSRKGHGSAFRLRLPAQTTAHAAA